ncbi:MAG: rod shape-determining protein [Clostridia bacterium]
MPKHNIGIDLGTGYIKIFVSGKGIVLSEATAITYDSYTEQILAIGNEAKKMLEKTPETIELVLPIDSGVISEFSSVEQILSFFVKYICKKSIFRPNIIITAPSSITELEKKTIVEVICSSGAGKVSLIDEPIASALGVGLTIDYPHGVMVVDIGSGTCDIAVISMGEVVVSNSLKIAGDDFDAAIVQYLKRERGILIGLQTAEKIKKTIGCAYKREVEFEMSVNGKDAVTLMPKIFTVTSTEIYDALKESIEMIFERIKDVLEQADPELCTDIFNEGIRLCGGSAKLYGFKKAFEDKFGVDLILYDDPEHAAAKGAGYALKDIDSLVDNGYAYRSKEIVNGLVE